jgi:hypothetical protein
VGNRGLIGAGNMTKKGRLHDGGPKANQNK